MTQFIFTIEDSPDGRVKVGTSVPAAVIAHAALCEDCQTPAAILAGAVLAAIVERQLCEETPDQPAGDSLH